MKNIAENRPDDYYNNFTNAAKAANTGRVQTQEEIDKRIRANTGKKRTEEQRENIKKGKAKNPYVVSEETKNIARQNAFNQFRKEHIAKQLGCTVAELPELPPPPIHIALEKKAAIYEINILGADIRFIGRTPMMYAARRIILSDLLNNKHKNNALQMSYDKYGFDAISFSVIEYCDKSEVKARYNTFIEENKIDNKYFIR